MEKLVLYTWLRGNDFFLLTCMEGEPIKCNINSQTKEIPICSLI